MKVVSAYQDGFDMEIGSGSTCFWYSDWTGLGLLYNILDYVHISETNLTPRDAWKDGGWNLPCLATPITSEVRDRIMQISVLRNINSSLRDCWVWKDNKEGHYTTTSGYAWLLGRTRSWNTAQD